MIVLKNKFIFTSSLAQSSKLVPFYAKQERKYEVGGWTLPGFWIPEQYCEVNAINCFNERYKKIKLGKALIATDYIKNIDFQQGDATNLNKYETNPLIISSLILLMVILFHI